MRRPSKGRGGPAEIHYGLIDERCFEVVARSLRILEDNGYDYVLTGGWAVFAYGSDVPSVDTDVLLDRAGGPAALQAVRGLGVTVGPNQQFEPIDMDAFSALLGTDYEMGDPDRGYVPREILAGRITRRGLDLGTRGRHEARVPRAGPLLFMKAKALYNRSLAWRALRDPRVMANIPPTDMATIRAKDVTYFLRKAGKDLYDVAFLAAHHDAINEAMDIARSTGLERDLQPLVSHQQPMPLRLFALDIAARNGDERTTAWLERHES